MKPLSSVSPTPNQLVVIDPSVANYQSLIEQLAPSYSYLLLSADSDGVTQIADFVAENLGFDAIHLISHGSPGQISLGSSVLSEATISGYSAQLNRIGTSLNAGGDFLIYGCDVAQGVIGQQLIWDIARLTQLDIAASTNPTGGTGDWILETAVGQIQHALPELLYDWSLAGYGPNVAWTRLIGSTGDDYAFALTSGLDGSVYVAGYTQSTTLDGQANAGGRDAFIAKFSPDGNKIWTKLIGSTGDEDAITLTTGLDGSIYVSGSTQSPKLGGQTVLGGSDTYVTKFAPDGTSVWTSSSDRTELSMAARSLPVWTVRSIFPDTRAVRHRVAQAHS